MRGIKDIVPPMGIIITACSDEDHEHFIADRRLKITPAYHMQGLKNPKSEI
jgi:hypothetical protein